MVMVVCLCVCMCVCVCVCVLREFLEDTLGAFIIIHDTFQEPIPHTQIKPRIHA